MLDYVTVLRHLLASHTTRAPSAVLSQAAIDSLFVGTLPPGAMDHDHNAGILAMLKVHRGKADEVDWSTGLCVFNRPGQKGGWGRWQGSVGWAGAAGTEYWIDKHAGVAVVLTTQVLPPRAAAIGRFKERVERALYEELEF